MEVYYPNYMNSLLSPIGSHRKLYGNSSKGKRSKKRKRREAKTQNTTAMSEETAAIPPVPELSSHILVGLSSISRHLENMCRGQSPNGNESEPAEMPAAFAIDNKGVIKDDAVKAQNLAAVFVCRSSQPSVLHAHLPQLMATASIASLPLPPMRLVQLPQGCETRLCSSLGLPRASFVGLLEDAPHSKPLLDFVRERVPIVEASWLKEVQSAKYRPVKINTICTTAPMAKGNESKS
jgi:ribonuclease P/MRP protein subunit POP3